MLPLISPLSHCPTVHTKPPHTHTHTHHPNNHSDWYFTFAFLFPFTAHTFPVECALQLITQYRYWILFCTLTMLAWHYSFLVYVIIDSLILRFKTVSAVFEVFFAVCQNPVSVGIDGNQKEKSWTISSTRNLWRLLREYIREDNKGDGEPPRRFPEDNLYFVVQKL